MWRRLATNVKRGMTASVSMTKRNGKDTTEAQPRGDTTAEKRRCGTGVAISEGEALYKRRGRQMIWRPDVVRRRVGKRLWGTMQLGSTVTQKTTVVKRNGKVRLWRIKRTRAQMRTCLNGTAPMRRPLLPVTKKRTWIDCVSEPFQDTRVVHSTSRQRRMSECCKTASNRDKEIEKWQEQSGPGRELKVGHHELKDSSACSDSEACSREESDKGKLTGGKRS